MPETSPSYVEPSGPASTAVILPLLAVTTGVIGPHMVVTLALGTEHPDAPTPDASAATGGALDGDNEPNKTTDRAALEARIAVDEAMRRDGRLVVVPRNANGAYARVGTIATVEQDGALPNGQRAVVLRGMHRAVLGAGVSGHGEGLWIEATPLVENTVSSPGVDTLVTEYRTVVEAILERRGARGLAESLSGLHDPNTVADLALYSPDLDFDQKVQVLETIDVAERLSLVLGWARDTLAELTVADELRRNLESQLGQEQREAVLRRQLAAIQEELGAGTDATAVADGYRAKLDQLRAAGAAENVVAAIDAELTKLARTPEQSPEHGWIVAWLDTMFELPWTKRAEGTIDLDQAAAMLDADHAGLDKVKERILEFLAVRKLRHDRGLDRTDPNVSAGTAATTAPRSAAAPTVSRRANGDGSILLLVGPPGVGKTSMGASVAATLGRPFARVALGGVRDESEIRGHRRTYVGARSGRFVRALVEAGVMNPVLLLDEIDKVGSDWRGDPSSALLEVLDPAQNHTFRDHYLEVDLDLSDVVFIATANQLDTIPGALRDRLEIIALEGYVDEEKVAIARHHLLARLEAAMGLRPGEVIITDDAIRTVINEQTREAGVRELERRLATVLRKLVGRVAGTSATPHVESTTNPPADTQASTDMPTAIVVGPEQVRELLGKARFHDEVAERVSLPGVATGLAVTGVGGGILFIEAATMSGDAGLTLTGQLGDVMRESAEIARSYLRSHRGAFGLDERIDTARLHLHVPAGATPKDGPSAGVTMTTALASLLSGRAVRANVAMTGEVTLTGKVLPVGGIRQKALAAHRAGIDTIILPQGNEADLDDVPANVHDELTVHLARDVAEVLAVALEPAA